jgi:hypothetical protein
VPTGQERLRRHSPTPDPPLARSRRPTDSEVQMRWRPTSTPGLAGQPQRLPGAHHQPGPDPCPDRRQMRPVVPNTIHPHDRDRQSTPISPHVRLRIPPVDPRHLVHPPINRRHKPAPHRREDVRRRIVMMTLRSITPTPPNRKHIPNPRGRRLHRCGDGGPTAWHRRRPGWRGGPGTVRRPGTGLAGLGIVEHAGRRQREESGGRDSHRCYREYRPDGTRHEYQNALTVAAEYTVSQGIPFLSASIRCGMS